MAHKDWNPFNKADPDICTKSLSRSKSSQHAVKRVLGVQIMRDIQQKKSISSCRHRNWMKQPNQRNTAAKIAEVNKRKYIKA